MVALFIISTVIFSIILGYLLFLIIAKKHLDFSKAKKYKLLAISIAVYCFCALLGKIDKLDGLDPDIYTTLLQAGALLIGLIYIGFFGKLKRNKEAK
jgi:O-antigen/teichoic acid export membrane protein